MQLPDVNVLIYAHRQELPEHELFADWLTGLATGQEAFALSELALSGFVRIVTNPKIFDPITPIDLAFRFVDALLERPQSVVVRPGERHWAIFRSLCRKSKARGALVADAYLAALAIESGCEFLTTDSDFGRFEGLRWQHPLGPKQQAKDRNP